MRGRARSTGGFVTCHRGGLSPQRGALAQLSLGVLRPLRSPRGQSPSSQPASPPCKAPGWKCSLSLREHFTPLSDGEPLPGAWCHQDSVLLRQHPQTERDWQCQQLACSQTPQSIREKPREPEGTQGSAQDRCSVLIPVPHHGSGSRSHLRGGDSPCILCTLPPSPSPGGASTGHCAAGKASSGRTSFGQDPKSGT